jgi:hypothetical protein
VLLGALLVRNGQVTVEALAQALEEMQRSGSQLGQTLVDLGLITSNTLAQALAEQYGFEYIDLSVVEVDPEATALLPENLARRHQALPVKVFDDTVVLVAVADPANLLAQDDLRLALGLETRIAVAASDQLEAAISRTYRVRSTSARSSRGSSRGRRSPSTTFAKDPRRWRPRSGS